MADLYRFDVRTRTRSPDPRQSTEAMLARFSRWGVRGPPKPEPVSLLSPMSPMLPVAGRQLADADAQDAFEERAAIMEYDGGLPRAQAEALARDSLQLTSPLSAPRNLG